MEYNFEQYAVRDIQQVTNFSLDDGISVSSITEILDKYIQYITAISKVDIYL